MLCVLNPFLPHKMPGLNYSNYAHFRYEEAQALYERAESDARWNTLTWRFPGLLVLRSSPDGKHSATVDRHPQLMLPLAKLKAIDTLVLKRLPKIY